MVFLLCWFFFTTTVTGLENVALRKSAKQKYIVGDAVASRAVDGNTNPYLDGGSCSTAYVPANKHSRWSVDLGYHYAISRIKVTTSKDGPAPSQLYVTARTIDGANEVFYSKVGSIPVGLVVDVVKPKPVKGRYIYVIDYVTDTPENFTLCEVEVYGSVEQQFHLDSKRGASNEMSREQGRSKLECGSYCLGKEICRSFLWQPSTNECILYSDIPSNMTSSADDFLGFITD